MLAISNSVCINVISSVEKKFSILMSNKLTAMRKEKGVKARKNLTQKIQELETQLQFHYRFDVEGNDTWFEFVEVGMFTEAEKLHEELDQNLSAITKVKRKLVMYKQLLMIIS